MKMTTSCLKKKRDFYTFSRHVHVILTLLRRFIVVLQPGEIQSIFSNFVESRRIGEYMLRISSLTDARNITRLSQEMPNVGLIFYKCFVHLFLSERKTVLARVSENFSCNGGRLYRRRLRNWANALAGEISRYHELCTLEKV